MQAEEAKTTAHLVSFSRSGDGTLLIRLTGKWRLRHGMPTASAVAGEFEPPSTPRKVAFEASGLTYWNSSLVNFVNQVNQLSRERSIEIDLSGLPAGLQRLVRLAEAVPETKARAPAKRVGWIERIGIAAIGFNQSAGEWQLAYTLQKGLNLGQPYDVPGYPTGLNSGPGGTGLP